MIKGIENVIINGVFAFKDPVAFRFFEGVEILLKNKENIKFVFIQKK